MLIKPKVRGFICTTAHPKGCANNVYQQINRVKAGGRLSNPLKNVLVIGASGGYGLPSRICAAFAGGARTLGISFEKQPTNTKLGSAGWYNNLAFEHSARKHGLEAQTLNIDAFSDVAKEQVVEIVKQWQEPIDLIVYSLASPVRKDPRTGEVWRSVIKPLGETVHIKSLNVDKAMVIDDLVLTPATEIEQESTIKVMGGEDWEMWMLALAEANVLAPGCQTISYTYVGSELTWPIYWHGTLGKAKEDLDRAAIAIRQNLAELEGDARVAVLQAVVTQSSAAIPVVPFYMSILFKVLKDKGIYEDCTDQISRLFRTGMDVKTRDLDAIGRIRMDKIELSDAVQNSVKELWPIVGTDNLRQETDFAGFRSNFLRLFGFGLDDIDYDADIATDWRP